MLLLLACHKQYRAQGRGFLPSFVNDLGKVIRSLTSLFDCLAKEARQSYPVYCTANRIIDSTLAGL